MKQHHRAVRALLLASVVVAAPAMAEKPQTYSSKIGDKALTGFSNIMAAPLEIPKNVINVYNECDDEPWWCNGPFGAAGGTILGIMNMGGRMMTGVVDLMTFPIPTQPMVYPERVWDDFDQATTYGKVMQEPPRSR